MVRTSQALLVLSLAAAFALSACNSSQEPNPSGTSSATVQPAPSTSVARAGHYHAALALVGQPAVTADGKSIQVAVNVTNDGTETFGSAAAPNSVNLGAHTVDASGQIVDNDLARGHLPQITPGATGKVTILLPIALALGHRVELLPVQEGVNWFDAWGTKPLTVGPFDACSDPTAGKVCDASGKPLPTAASTP